MSATSSLGVRSPTHVLNAASLAVPPPQHARNVSSSSEFPMRTDSYSAREISQRVIGSDPADQPTALPANLPYPGIQQQAAFTGGMKHSQSMQSVASYASKKSGFFSHMHMRKGGKKEVMGLGPPTSSLASSSTASGATKKDIRGLQISGPSIGPGGARSPSPQKVVDLGSYIGSTNSLSAPKIQQSISTPLGPRVPRMGTYTPPPGNDRSASVDLGGAERGRGSLDMGLSRLNNGPSARNSLDSGGWERSVRRLDQLACLDLELDSEVVQ
jgi:hypothetical protein